MCDVEWCPKQHCPVVCECNMVAPGEYMPNDTHATTAYLWLSLWLILKLLFQVCLLLQQTCCKISSYISLLLCLFHMLKSFFHVLVHSGQLCLCLISALLQNQCKNSLLQLEEHFQNFSCVQLRQVQAAQHCHSLALCSVSTVRSSAVDIL